MRPEKLTLYLPSTWGHRQPVGFGVAGLGGIGDAGAAGVGQAQGPGHLVEGLAGGVVHRPAQDPEFGVVLHLDNVAVAPRGHQAQEGGLQLGVGQIEGRNVAPQMVDRHQGFAGGVGQALGKVDPHQHRPDQARGKGDCHRVHLVDGAAGVG